MKKIEIFADSGPKSINVDKSDLDLLMSKGYLFQDDDNYMFREEDYFVIQQMIGNLYEKRKIKKLNETGEWPKGLDWQYVKDTPDSGREEEEYYWIKSLEEDLNLIKKRLKYKNINFEIVDIRGFDKYQGPYADVIIENDRYEFWTVGNEGFTVLYMTPDVKKDSNGIEADVESIIETLIDHYVNKDDYHPLSEENETILNYKIMKFSDMINETLKKDKIMTTRQQALNWWRNLPLKQIIEIKPPHRHIETLSGPEIENIWKRNRDLPIIEKKKIKKFSNILNETVITADWDKFEKVRNQMGDKQLLEEVIKGMDTTTFNNLFDYIIQMWELKK